MPETIESFVKKLQAEGVDAGREAADRIINDARREATKIIADANDEAAKIVSRAETEADKQLARGKSELELAARDAVLKLRVALNRALEAMLARRIEEKLSDPDYLEEMIREVITAYAKADAGRRNLHEINMSREMREKLNHNVLQEFFWNINDKQDTIAIRATIAKAGFEYKINGATVEVSPDSVSNLLSEMVSPALQEIIDSSVSKQDEAQ